MPDLLTTDGLLLCLLATVTIFASSVLQGAVGFGANLIAVPLLLMIGFNLPAAVSVCLVIAVAQNSVGCYELRRYIPWNRLLRPVLIRLIALPLGAAFMFHADGLRQETVRQIVGAIVLLCVAAQLYSRQRTPAVEPEKPVAWIWEWIACSTSGILQGFVGMAGPPLVLWVLAQRWQANVSRAFLFTTFVAGMLPHGIVLYLVFGPDLFSALGLSVVLLPAALIGTMLGVRAGRILQGRRLEFAAHTVLILIAISAIATPIVKQLSAGSEIEHSSANS